jgi:2-polyprenyl-6-methoxyphenol hydroxylase-like FAD-dependent oxidoreductase
LTNDTDGFFRTAHGPGWALVGDAGYHKDPITAQGMLDAFRDADLVSVAIDEGLDDELDRSLAQYQASRDAAVGPMYDFTCQLAHVELPPPPEMQQLIAALVGSQPEIDRFFGVMAGSVSVADFYAPHNVERLLAA